MDTLCNVTQHVYALVQKPTLSKQIVLGPFRRLGALFRIYSRVGAPAFTLTLVA
jgi:hypothetical protein